ncbi:1-acyl-sn-glycerol-3-phosphate acyltransferase [Nicoliella spurrieriana]|uniref:1-acyl-sn-glycerol-3-phosphate acyltransferase n=1 Tax=Nicoliella spurrieriana TaxID=2925830 RepID=A0A976X5B6_9LACO|nr:1-acyl-sn-glycerol-3-phosphate acyltransferase [Nicoliella spurrieriana]UQS86491.1 1-acyl-sn-glycerol-3-phosphate acyltransferase [Nicoliella spurrieriana]
MYSFLRFIFKVITQLINGRVNVKNKNKLPDGNYILVGPHRAWFDMLFFALAASPKKFTFLAKKELFNNFILRYILNKVNAIPVDRQKPGPSVIKKPVKLLRTTDLSIIIFPSGSRHSDELKAGAALISKLAGVPLVPVVYQGPLSFKQLFTRKPVSVAFGDPIQFDRKSKINDEEQAKLEAQMQASFDQLDHEIDPNFKYVDVSKK